VAAVKRHLALVVAGLVTVLVLAGQLARAAAGPEPDDPQDSRPAFASDGVHVAFEREVPGGRHVLAMTSGGKELTVDSARARLRGYVPGTTHLLVQSSDSETLVITGSRFDGPLATLHGTDATAAPDGSRVAYLRGGALYVSGIDGSGERAIATGVSPPSWDAVGPAWSPDGTRIAISSGPSLLLVNADGSGSKVLWSGLNQNVNPSWSADGLQVAWETNADAHWAIWIWAGCNGCGVRMLLSSPTANYRFPQFSPVEPNTLAFISDRQHAKGGATKYQFALYTRQLSSTVLHKLVDDVHPYSPPRWSATASLIAVAAGQECRRWGIYITQSDVGSQPRRRSNICRFGGTPAADTIRGSEYFDLINGLGGNDVIDGRGGNDKISGNGGDDTIHGGAGNDFILAGPGNDRIFGGAGNDTIIGGNGIDRIDCGPGDDTVEAAGPLDIIARSCEHITH
jgi:dipeptidyl aminopeptidase/acylaminoacyl peptidase